MVSSGYGAGVSSPRGCDSPFEVELLVPVELLSEDSSSSDVPRVAVGEGVASSLGAVMSSALAEGVVSSSSLVPAVGVVDVPASSRAEGVVAFSSFLSVAEGVVD